MRAKSKACCSFLRSIFVPAWRGIPRSRKGKIHMGSKGDPATRWTAVNEWELFNTSKNRTLEATTSGEASFRPCHCGKSGCNACGCNGCLLFLGQISKSRIPALSMIMTPHLDDLLPLDLAQSKNKCPPYIARFHHPTEQALPAPKAKSKMNLLVSLYATSKWKKRTALSFIV